MTLHADTSAPVVTLLTDFGTADYFAGAMKGAVLCVNPRAQVIDITHDIPAHDIEAGAFTLLAAYESFPAGTVHVAVVDPGVGSERRALLVAAREHLFVGPDNGLLSYVCEREQGARAFHLNEARFFRRGVSATFHGRDVFAPVAGALAKGTRAEELGTVVTDYVRLAPLAPQRSAPDELSGRVIHIDRFGNLITNISRADVEEMWVGDEFAGGACLALGGREVSAFRRTFADGAGTPGEVFAVWGSAGFLEVVAYCDSAARLLGARRGDQLMLRRV